MSFHGKVVEKTCYLAGYFREYRLKYETLSFGSGGHFRRFLVR